MDNNARGNSMRQMIVSNMQARSTEELLAIWKTHDNEEWTEQAFSVVEDILRERLGSVPEQNQALDDDEGEEDEQADEVDVYHDRTSILNIASLARNASRVVPVLGGIWLYLQVQADMESIAQRVQGLPSASTYSLLAGIVGKVIVSGALYLVLRAIAEILYLLVDLQESQAKTGKDTG
jgi:hypothetical protein